MPPKQDGDKPQQQRRRRYHHKRRPPKQQTPAANDDGGENIASVAPAATASSSTAAPPLPTLNPGARTFQPTPTATSSSEKPQNTAAKRKPKNKPSASSAPQPRPPRAAHAHAPSQESLRDSLTRRLNSQSYECSVCYDPIRRHNAVWSCDRCWSVYHVDCVSEWARRSVAENGRWRCPGCQRERAQVPRGDHCFCGKRDRPQPDRFGDAHSCGQVCGRPLAEWSSMAISQLSLNDDASGTGRTCPHRCSTPCHPGPCDPCQAQAPPALCRCYCGKQFTPLKCSDVAKRQRLECGKVCGRQLACGRHRCRQKCHPVDCSPCSVEWLQHCHCGRDAKRMPCGTNSEEFSCGKVCGKAFQCGRHHCQLSCHAGDHGECPYSPSAVRTCFCGRIQHVRESCEDPIPACGERCPKRHRRACGHETQCSKTCHDGGHEFEACTNHVSLSCRCGKHRKEFPCSDVQALDPNTPEPPPTDDQLFFWHGRPTWQCQSNTRPCSTKLPCGHHRCMRKCCDSAPESHQCHLSCGKQLACGKHECPERCHRGQCAPCTVVSLSPYYCPCGRTSVDPPIYCKNRVPENTSCPFPCSLIRECGHQPVDLDVYNNPMLAHRCHPEGTPCAPCMVFGEKACLCGKQRLRAVCSQRVLCAEVCEKPLQCGHLCSKGCHDGACLVGAETCQLRCGKELECGHPCQQVCHQNVCANACQTPITIHCPCGNLSVHRPCSSPETLECTDACAKLARNRRLAAAFELPPFSAELLQLARQQLSAVITTELSLLRPGPWVFVASPLVRLLLQELYPHLLVEERDGQLHVSGDVHKPEQLLSAYLERSQKQCLKQHRHLHARHPPSLVSLLNEALTDLSCSVRRYKCLFPSIGFIDLILSEDLDTSIIQNACTDFLEELREDAPCSCQCLGCQGEFSDAYLVLPECTVEWRDARPSLELTFDLTPSSIRLTASPWLLWSLGSYLATTFRARLSVRYPLSVEDVRVWAQHLVATRERQEQERAASRSTLASDEPALELSQNPYEHLS